MQFSWEVERAVPVSNKDNLLIGGCCIRWLVGCRTVIYSGNLVFDFSVIFFFLFIYFIFINVLFLRPLEFIPDIVPISM